LRIQRPQAGRGCRTLQSAEQMIEGGMGERYVNIDRETPMLLPVDLREWVAENDLARLILEAVEMCDLRGARVNARGSGSAQYPPGMMLALLIYCYATGVLSSRRIERASYESVTVRYLCANTHPDHDTIARFRRENGKLYQECFAQVLSLAREAGVLKAGTISLDGSRMAGAGSRHAVRSLGQIEAELRELAGQLAEKAEQADLLGAETEGTQLPGELSNALERRQKLLEAKARLEERRRQAQEENRRDGQGSQRRSSRVSVSEPESRTMMRGDGSAMVQGYNAQAAADAGESGLIVGMHLSDEANDKRQLLPGLEALPPEAGPVETVLIDKGYDNAAQIERAEDIHHLTVLCPPQYRHTADHPRNRRVKPARIFQLREQMRERFQKPHWAQLYRRRQPTVEGVFARIKSNMGFRRFHCWGRAAAAAEWALVCLAHNLRLLGLKFQAA